MSDDDRYALTLILFTGSVFSPRYFRARQLGRGGPEDHPAVNIALYGTGRTRWAFTEYAGALAQRSAQTLRIGDNIATWDGSCLDVVLDERTAPFPSRIRGRIRLHPQFLCTRCVTLDSSSLHRWQPLAARARIEVDLDEPALRWKGNGYLDTNWGDVGLETSFRRWTWSRADVGDGAAMLYDVAEIDGTVRTLGVQFNRSGEADELRAEHSATLPGTLWGLQRSTRCDGGSPAVIATFEDGPFYARSLIASQLAGQNIRAVHESLSLERFRAGWVRSLLPFRMRHVGN